MYDRCKKCGNLQYLNHNNLCPQAITAIPATRRQNMAPADVAVELSSILTPTESADLAMRTEDSGKWLIRNLAMKGGDQCVRLHYR